MRALVEEEIKRAGGLSASRLCELADLPRSSFYRKPTVSEGVSAREAAKSAESDLRDRLQAWALEFPSYGYRRLTAALKRDGFAINRKRVLRLMREDNLLCLRRKRFSTTNSDHAGAIYPNRAATLSLTGTDQLWVADLTYIRLGGEFVYLAVILDAFSRRVIGWELDRTLDATLPLAALRRALRERRVSPGLVHHSDRGVQYASDEYTGLLQANGVQISMSRKGNPYDNAKAESFMKTLKYEEGYLQDYQSLAEARASVERFLEAVYNRKRLHSSLGYLPPAEFEETLRQPLPQLPALTLAPT